MKQMNKKAKGGAFQDIAIAIIIGVLAIVILLSGGLVTVVNITSFLSKVPVFVWVFLGVIVLIRWLK